MSAEPLDDVIDIQGDVPPDDQDAVLEPDEVEHERVPSQTEIDHGAATPDLPERDGEAASLDGLDLDDLREGETDDPIAATEEGLVYVPPIDPPVVADAEAGDGITVGAGAAVSAESGPDDDDHRSFDLDPESGIEVDDFGTGPRS